MIKTEMGEKSKTPQHPSWYMPVLEVFNDFTKCLEDKIKKEQEQLEACKKKTELASKLAFQRKINSELTEQLSELNHRSTELDRLCSMPQTISDNDQKRLDNAKEMYQIGKELTGIRFDFSAPSNIAKGYIKSDSRKLLQPFEVPEGDNEALWSVMQSTADPIWTDKENQHKNH